MNWSQIAKRWRKYLVNRLQERYGLAEEEARKKADVWLQWIGNQPIPTTEARMAAASEQRSSSHHVSPTHRGKFRQRTARS